MIVRSDEFLEERPGLSGQLPEKDCLVGRQMHFGASDRLADPPRDSGGGKPEPQNRDSHIQRSGLRQRQIHRRGRGKNGPDPHHPTVGDEVCTPIEVLIARWIPFEQSGMRGRHPPDRAHNGLHTVERLVGKERDRQYRLNHVLAGRTDRDGGMLLR